ncbi:aminotransferase [Mycena belliarum]|uniref:Branched-chain-amino-acid aminotransferase n=1 Tax=Mycena belliarum TaxID=1033014 RepID=A0AAD6XQS5_9AGAR|nr:aminotransferase [Mycena belliae]
MASATAHTNGHAHTFAPLDASRLTIERATTLKPVPEQGTYAFGDIKTDHMLVMTCDPLTGWSAPEIKPYGPLALDPASNCLQYATNVFEGMKAFMGPDGKPRLFRPDQNMARLQTSAARMALPAFDPDALLVCINKLVSLEARWIPSLSGHSLYIRPTMIGTKPSIKVGPSEHAILYTIVTPVGPYFPPTDDTPDGISLLAVGEHVRSWPGGTGGYKLGLNYSPGFVPQRAAAALGYDQVLWLLGDDKRVTEAGAMNFFAVAARADGGVDVVTPPLDGTILPGITRDAALVLLRAHAVDPARGVLALPPTLKIYVHERHLTLPEMSQWAGAGRLRECFGVGTAVLVVAIERIGDVVDEQVAEALEGASKAKPFVDITPTTKRGLGELGTALYDKLLALKEGRENFEGWSVLCE